MLWLLAALLALSAGLGGCTSLGEPGEGSPNANRFLGDVASSLTHGTPQTAASFGGGGQAMPTQGYSDLTPASQLAPGSSAPAGRGITDNGQRFSINFVDVGVQEFVRAVFEEVLHENVVVDPSLGGQITVRTASPISKSAAIDLVRTVLAGANATITESDGIYRVSSRTGQGASSPAERQDFRAFQLKYIDAEQAKSALQPFNGAGAVMSSISGSRVLVASGSAADLDRFQQVLETLDVDQMRQRSFALVPLHQAGAAAVAGELNAMFKSEDAKGFEALPVERMNAVLLLGTSASGLQRARQWVSHLDQAGEDERRVNVYPVQNRRASELAAVLQQMIGSGGGGGTVVAAGLTEKTASTDASSASSTASAAAVVETSSLGGSSGVAISADPATNSLVVVATPDDYRIIEKAIRRLDVMPTQVLIEATILEVTLNDKLRHGVRWYFEYGNNRVMLTDASGSSIGPIVPGF
ncbi:MAG: hypothetical protein J0H54_08240, partial [Rhizobiales bacterium]|nr:hypothetical protein [Hyphomicrobiales bacterium]